jgi:hypothetical protein
MKPQAAAIVALLGWLTVACQYPPPTPIPTLPPTATSTATSAPTATSASTPVPTAISTSTPAPTAPPTATPTPLTDLQATDLLRQEVASRGVDPDTVRIRIGGQPRRVSIRYTSTYHPDSREFRAQMILNTLAAASVTLRVDPPVEGGLDMAVLPVEGGELGLLVTTVDRSVLDVWASGSLSDQEFVAEWQTGIVTRE